MPIRGLTVKIKEYIESGALEAYVMGSASEQEVDELLFLKNKYPEVRDALYDLEESLERIAQNMSIPPPPGTWMKIESELNAIVQQTNVNAVEITKIREKENGQAKKDSAGDYLEVQGPSSHIRVHKIWRWILLAIFILGKIFLGFAIYYFLENRQAKEQIQDLKTELRQIKERR